MIVWIHLTTWNLIKIENLYFHHYLREKTNQRQQVYCTLVRSQWKSRHSVGCIGLSSELKGFWCYSWLHSRFILKTRNHSTSSFVSHQDTRTASPRLTHDYDIPDTALLSTPHDHHHLNSQCWSWEMFRFRNVISNRPLQCVLRL